METEYIGSAIVPNGYNGHKATVHYCTNPRSGALYAVWQEHTGLTGWHSLVTLADLPDRFRLRAVNLRAMARGAEPIVAVLA